MGPFKKCTCIASQSQRRFRFEGFHRNGHEVGAAGIVIHEGGCQGAKGGNKPQVWLFKCGGSTVAKIDHNNYLHPRADHSGRLSMQPGLRHLMEDYIAAGDWKSAIKAVQTALILPQGDSGHNRLRHFPKVSTPQRRPQKVYALNVRITKSNDSEVECWGIFGSRELAEERLIQPEGITWHTTGEEPTSFDGHRNTDCDDHFPGLVEAYATIDTHVIQE